MFKSATPAPINQGTPESQQKPYSNGVSNEGPGGSRLVWTGRRFEALQTRWQDALGDTIAGKTMHDHPRYVDG